MIDIGDIYLTDLGAEQPRRVLVLSNSDFNRRSDRVLVAPEWRGAAVLVPFPWIVEGDDDVHFAVDHVETIAVDRLLRPAGRAPFRTTWLARRALLAISG